MDGSPPSPTALVVNSPRRTLSRLHNRSLRFPSSSDHFPDPFHRKSAATGSSAAEFAAGEHGPKPSEVYGFVGSITTVVATVIYLLWAYTPEPWLHSIGITYYPSKYWALAIPSFVIVALALMMMLYMGLNFMVTPESTSMSTLFDEYSRERSTPSCSSEDDKPIEPISDIGIDQINNMMFNTALTED